MLREATWANSQIRGTVDVAKVVVAEGMQPWVLYRAGGNWFRAPTTAQSNDDGTFMRFTFELNANGSDIELIPFLRTSDGGRIFDHNRNPAPQRNYVINGTQSRITSDQSCMPLAGSDGTDAGDAQCHVILRRAAQPISAGQFVVENRFFVWDGFVDVSAAAEKIGGVPELLWSGKLDRWTTLGTTPTDGGEGGLHRYRFHLVSDITAESPTALQTVIELIPNVRFPSGGRLFDHNVEHGNYRLDYSLNEMQIPDRGAHCK